jgi:hypothetical protein
MVHGTLGRGSQKSIELENGVPQRLKLGFEPDRTTYGVDIFTFEAARAEVSFDEDSIPGHTR